MLVFIYTMSRNPMDTGSPHLLVEQTKNTRNTEALSMCIQIFLTYTKKQNNYSHNFHFIKCKLCKAEHKFIKPTSTVH